MKYFASLGISALIVLAVGCGAGEEERLKSAQRMADRLKQSSLPSTDAVKFEDYIILGEKSLGIRATLVGWNSGDSVNREFMEVLAHDNARKVACGTQALRGVLAEGVRITFSYASADRKDSLETTIREEHCNASEE